MDWSIFLSVAVLVWLAFAFDVLGFAARDELWLRGLMLIGSGFYLFYYYLVTDVPLWDAIATNGILAAVNLIMILAVISERSTLFMGPDVSALFGHFKHLSPGQFRRILRHADRKTATDGLTVAHEGAPLSQLFFVLSGTATVRKNGADVDIPGTPFIGELAFLTNQPASATVILKPGTDYLVWDGAELSRMLDRAPALNNAFMAEINRDLAQKVKWSQPLDP